MSIKLSNLTKSVLSCFSLILFSSIAIEAKADNLLVEHGTESFYAKPPREYLNFPSANIINNVISQSIRSSDKLCYPQRTNPHVVGYARGSFTAPHASEALYLVNIGDNCNSRAIGTIRIVVARGNQVTAYGEVPGNYFIKKITDINNDGVNEILLEASWLGQGAFFIWNTFLEIRPQGILTLSRFQTYLDDRGTSAITDSVDNIRYNVSTESISKVYYQLGANNRLAVLKSEWMIRACSKRNQNDCTDFEPLFSYRIPLASSDNNFFSAYSPYFQTWFHRVCHNVCEVYNP